LVKNKCYLLYIHPRGWRQINSKIGKLIKQKQIIYLNMNGLKKGLELFKCSTDFDYYLIQNTNTYKLTFINDYKNNDHKLYISNNLKFIPNHSIEDVYTLINDKQLNNNFINDQSSYEPRKNGIGIDLDNLINIDKFIDNFYKLETNNILKYLKYTNYALDWRLFTYLKKDFYNYLK